LFGPHNEIHSLDYSRRRVRKSRRIDQSALLAPYGALALLFVLLSNRA
jgi:hypothetical protein